MAVELAELRIELRKEGIDRRRDAAALQLLRGDVHAELELALWKEGLETIAGHGDHLARGRIEQEQHEVIGTTLFDGAVELATVEEPEGVNRRWHLCRDAHEQECDPDLGMFALELLDAAFQSGTREFSEVLIWIGDRFVQRGRDAEHAIRDLQRKAALAARGVGFGERGLAGGTTHEARA
jgi:hypothetical protein